METTRHLTKLRVKQRQQIGVHNKMHEAAETARAQQQASARHATATRAGHVTPARAPLARAALTAADALRGLGAAARRHAR